MSSATQHPITGRTKVLGLIADPVVQTRSPDLVNAMLERQGRFGEFVLLPMQVPGGAIAETITALRRMKNFAGAIVSMPHKTAIVTLLDELTPDARLVGAVNVIRRTVEGRMIGTIMDGEGFVAGLKAAGHDVVGASCFLAGVGGAASAIALALARHGCGSLTIHNRTISKAESLVARVRQAFPAVRVEAGEGRGQSYDIAVNATSLGMNNGDELPIANEIIEASTLIVECVIGPEITPLLDLARRKGRAIHTGVHMLEGQLDLMLPFMGVD